MGTSDYLRTIRAKVGNDLLLVGHAAAVVLNNRSTVLLTRRRDSGKWSTPEGIIEPGEDPADAAVRVVYEETGMRVIPERISGIYGGPELLDQPPGGNHVAVICIVFVCRPVDGESWADSGAEGDILYCAPDALPSGLLPNVHTHISDALSGQAECIFHYTPGGAYFVPGYMPAVRAKIGHDLLQIVGAGAVVINEKSEVLLMQRTDTGCWATPTGKIEPGEEPAETVIREVYEETGVHVLPERITGVYGGPELLYQYPRGDRVALIAIIFRCRPVGGAPRPDHRESAGAGYFALDALPEHLLAIHHCRIADALRGDRRVAFRYRGGSLGTQTAST